MDSERWHTFHSCWTEQNTDPHDLHKDKWIRFNPFTKWSPTPSRVLLFIGNRIFYYSIKHNPYFQASVTVFILLLECTFNWLAPACIYRDAQTREDVCLLICKLSEGWRSGEGGHLLVSGEEEERWAASQRAEDEWVGSGFTLKTSSKTCGGLGGVQHEEPEWG